MGVSARVASLQKQLTARDEEIKRLKQELEREVERMRNGAAVLEDHLETSAAALAMQAKTLDLTMPIVDAAVDFVLSEDGPEIGEALTKLRAAVHAARSTVEAAEVPA